MFVHDKNKDTPLWIGSIDRFHVTSLPPCWRTITKDSSSASIVSSSNMAATSLSFNSLGIDCKPSIDLVKSSHETSDERKTFYEQSKSCKQIFSGFVKFVSEGNQVTHLPAALYLCFPGCSLVFGQLPLSPADLLWLTRAIAAKRDKYKWY